MKLADKLLIRNVGRLVAAIGLLFIVCHFLPIVAVSALLVIGLWASLAHRGGITLACYVMIPLLIVANPVLCPIGGLSSAVLRLGFFGMTVLLLVSSGKRRGSEQVPLGMLWLYVIVAIISSTGGYAPLISYLKIINFGCFIVGIWLGLRNLDRDPATLMFLRSFLLAIAAVIIIGSIATLPFPGIAYFTSVKDLIYREGVDFANSYAAHMTGLRLFTGITNHSQCMATLAVVTIGWVLCDMLFVENRMSTLHVVLLLCGIPLLYMTKSRGALFSGAVTVVMIYVYCFKYLAVSRRLKVALRSGMTLIVVAIALAAVALEIRDKSISKWFRKTDDVVSDRRSAIEAFTESRMGLVEQNMYDYRRNPLFGSGFQVAYHFQYKYRDNHFAISAPIEKGVLPLMILGETGILGALAFIVFLVVFYVTCTQRRYTVTATLFTILLANNMGEATFFSTGGSGGIIWVMSIVGGFCIDMVVLHRKRMKTFMAQRAMAGAW